MLRRVLPLALALAPLAGCIIIEVPGDLDFDFEPTGEDAWSDDASSLQGGRGRVSGDIGAVRGFDAATDDVQGSVDGYWTSITVTANDDQGRMGMVIVELDGVDIRALPSGAYRYSADGVEGPAALSGVYVTGCSSDADDSYDAPSQDGVIIVDNDGDECSVEVAADLPSDDVTVTTLATAAFTLAFE